MTISDAMPMLLASGLRSTTTTHLEGSAPQQALGQETSLEFRIGPEHGPTEVLRRARRFAAMVLPALLGSAPEAEPLGEAVLAVLTELVDVTARHRASVDLAGRISYDGSHALVSIGEMNRILPEPQEEPGLYLVHRVAEDLGQHEGFDGGYVTWAAIRA
ncbi:hypothetical protein ACIQU6_27900 [Streptomyces sp. NPDC090442]|uniref:hypothetical protein n=1 Tax=Streptomyces sp. NPDC090442 TaxID=3365962 RepID=UPI003806598C